VSPLGPTPKPGFFATPSAFRAWLVRNHASRTELWVGYWKRGTGRRSVTWAETVDEALCFGWIDGIRRARDARSFVVRFTPRKPTSAWSARNLRRFALLLAAGRVHASGRKAHDTRHPGRAHGYSVADRPDTLPPAFARRLRADRTARAYLVAQPPWYRRAAFHWVTSAKQEATRERRFVTLLADSAAGRRVKPLRRPGTSG
jgi:uncharacterized protein YdeI (YjbR/CyaY-like superfamily)